MGVIILIFWHEMKIKIIFDFDETAFDET